MSRALLLSHGELAKEILATTRLVLGEISGVDFLTLPSGVDLSQYEQDIRRRVEEASDGILILTDIFGGTPFITASRVYASLENKYLMEVVTGMNLAMVLQVCGSLGSMTVGELKKEVMAAGAEGIIDLKDKV